MTTLPLLVLTALLSAQDPEPQAEGAGGPEIVRMPRGAVAPALATDEEGGLHVVYLTAAGGGEGRRADIHYREWGDDEQSWSEPVEANSRSMSAIRPSIAVADGWVHVIWGATAPRGFWYTRMQVGGERFERERDVLPSGARGLEVGPVVAADGKGNVFLTWHQGDFRKEEERAMFLLWSGNHGRSWSPARRISPRGAGACGCCDFASVVGEGGELFVAFRAARNRTGRDMILLSSRSGRSFDAETIDEWYFEACPRSTVAMATNGEGDVSLVWQTEGDWYWGRADDLENRIPLADAGGRDVKGPAVAVNGEGETMVAWFEGRSRQSGGMVHWQVYDDEGEPTERHGKTGPAPARGGLGVAARPDGTFVLAY